MFYNNGRSSSTLYVRRCRSSSPERFVRYYRFTVVSAVLTIFFCTVSVIFFSLELNRLDQFFMKYQQQKWNPKSLGIYCDKNFLEVSLGKMMYLLKMARIEKAVLAASICANVALVVAAGGLIKGAILQKPKMFVFWGLCLSASFLIGLAYTLMDCVIYGFSSRTNGALLTWLGFGIIFGHCLRSVYKYNEMIKEALTNGGGDSRSRSRSYSRSRSRSPRLGRDPAQNCGVAMFDASLMAAHIFTITGPPNPDVTITPSGVIIQPPCYEEAIASDTFGPKQDELDYISPPPDTEGEPPPTIEEITAEDAPPPYEP